MSKNRPTAGKPLKDLRILVMEDEFLIAMDVEQICHDHGAGEVVIIRTLKELDDGAIVERGISVAVVDVMLGGESTLEFARALKESRIPFVFATGYGEKEHLFECFPGVRVVGKPYSGPALVTAMIEAMTEGEAEDASRSV